MGLEQILAQKRAKLGEKRFERTVQRQYSRFVLERHFEEVDVLRKATGIKPSRDAYKTLGKTLLSA